MIETTEFVVNISEKAKKKIKAIFSADENLTDSTGVRLGVVGGGCSGLSYNIDFGEKKENDNIYEFDGVRVFVDPKSSIYLKGTMLDFDDGLQGKGFVFKNPNATNTCGCGESFSV